jgi:integrase
MTLYSGISVSEWSRASKGDIDLEKGTLRLKKGEALLTEKARSYVMEVMKEPADGGLIFSNRSGRAVIASNAIVTLRKILERYGISQNVTSRNLQASVVNYWLMNGKDADYIKKHTGMTNRSFIKMAERIRLINALTQ